MNDLRYVYKDGSGILRTFTHMPHHERFLIGVETIFHGSTVHRPPVGMQARDASHYWVRRVDFDENRDEPFRHGPWQLEARS